MRTTEAGARSRQESEPGTVGVCKLKNSGNVCSPLNTTELAFQSNLMQVKIVKMVNLCIVTIIEKFHFFAMVTLLLGKFYS